MKVLFVSAFDNKNDPSRIYRCDNPAKEIIAAGGSATVIGQSELMNQINLIRFVDLIIFQRVHYTADVGVALRLAREVGCAVAVEYDDLIFVPWEIEQQGAFRSGAIGNIEEHRRNSKLRLQYLPWVDAAIVSTPAIAEKFEELGVPAFVAKNAIDDKRFNVRTRKNRGLKKILYMSGTATHGADFALIHQPLIRFLKTRTDVSLTLLGQVTAPAGLIGLPNVETVGKLPMEELLPFISDFDLSLVPLEDTVFNQCKSSLKFYESGLASVPVLASPRREFASDIKHGFNGFLAETKEEWFQVLEKCYLDRSLLARATRGAYADVMRLYAQSRRGDKYLRMVEAICDKRRLTQKPSTFNERSMLV